jgi:hypothetical protein
LRFLRAERPALSTLEKASGIQMTKHMYQQGGQPGPASLMTGADASPVITVKVFVKQ